MTNEPSPRPWKTEQFGGDQPCCLVDADGNPVCVQYGSADAALIVNAVNIYDHQFDRYMQALRAERDQLRAIVRQMADMLDHVSREYRFDFNELVREARAAIGEDVSP